MNNVERIEAPQGFTSVSKVRLFALLRGSKTRA
jgi:hypothetical protein